MIRPRSNGFTLIELTLAMAIFSLVMVIITGTIIRMYAIYEASIEIRATQQSARFIADKISVDARNADRVVSVTKATSSGIPVLSDLCFVTTTISNGAPGNKNSYNAQKYSVDYGGVYDTAHQNTLYSSQVSLAPLDNSQLAFQTACKNATMLTPIPLSSSDTSVTLFTASDAKGNLLNLRLGVAAKTGLSELSAITPTGVICTHSFVAGQTLDARFCSVTNLLITGGSKGAIQP